ncbi:MAG: hypothetical protein Q9P44_20650 [Anaerolineae bacterium]|nr:hypothetical protein [Anaerolineae bacterium]
MNNVLSSMRFMLMWVFGSVIAFYGIAILALIILFASSMVAAFLFMTTQQELTVTGAIIFTVIVYSLIGLFSGLIVGSVQKSLLQQKTEESFKGWIVASALGGIIGLNITGFTVGQQIMNLISNLKIPPQETVMMLGLQLLLIPLAAIGICQASILMRYVKGAWVWVLANVVGGVVVISLSIATATGTLIAPFSIIFIVIALSAAPGIVTGFAMLWLLNFNWKY